MAAWRSPGRGGLRGSPVRSRLRWREATGGSLPPSSSLLPADDGKGPLPRSLRFRALLVHPITCFPHCLCKHCLHSAGPIRSPAATPAVGWDENRVMAIRWQRGSSAGCHSLPGAKLLLRRPLPGPYSSALSLPAPFLQRRRQSVFCSLFCLSGYAQREVQSCHGGWGIVWSPKRSFCMLREGRRGKGFEYPTNLVNAYKYCLPPDEGSQGSKTN